MWSTARGRESAHRVPSESGTKGRFASLRRNGVFVRDALDFKSWKDKNLTESVQQTLDITNVEEIPVKIQDDQSVQFAADRGFLIKQALATRPY